MQPLPQILRERLASVAVATDVALATAVTALGLLRDSRRFAPPVGAETPVRPYLLTLPPWAMITAHLVGGVLLLGRRRCPEAVAVALAALSVVVPVFAAIAMTYSVVRYGRRLRVAVALALLLVTACLGGADLLPLIGSFRWTDGDPYTVMLIGALLMALGLYRRAASDLRTAVAAQVAQGAAEQRALSENRRLQERAALAVDLHDEVARHLSLMALTAGAVDDDLDEAERARQRQLLAHGRAASEALYALIRALTGSASAGAGSAAGDGPAALIALGRLDGVCFDARELSCHPTDDAAWPVVASVAAEAVVNARRHAPGSAVRVGVSRSGGRLHLVVANTAGSGAGDDDVRGAGLGLRAARERCESRGGSFEVRPSPDGGMQVLASVPVGVGDGR